MDDSDRFIISFFIFSLLILITLSLLKIDQIEDKLDDYHIIQAECKEVITYKQFGRPQLLCYMGDKYNYSNNEKRIIQQWKNGK